MDLKYGRQKLPDSVAQQMHPECGETRVMLTQANRMTESEAMGKKSLYTKQFLNTFTTKHNQNTALTSKENLRQNQYNLLSGIYDHKIQCWLLIPRSFWINVGLGDMAKNSYDLMLIIIFLSLKADFCS